MLVQKSSAVDHLNAVGKGVVRIEFVGGPEAIPTLMPTFMIEDGPRTAGRQPGCWS